MSERGRIFYYSISLQCGHWCGGQGRSPNGEGVRVPLRRFVRARLSLFSADAERQGLSITGGDCTRPPLCGLEMRDVHSMFWVWGKSDRTSSLGCNLSPIDSCGEVTRVFCAACACCETDRTFEGGAGSCSHFSLLPPCPSHTNTDGCVTGAPASYVLPLEPSIRPVSARFGTA